MKFKKIINKKIVSVLFYTIIIFFNFSFLYCIIMKFSDKKIQLNESIKVKRTLFSGFESKKTEYICAKADNDLLSLYEQEYFDSITIDISLKKSTTFLYKYFKDNNSNDLKKYIFTFIFEISLSFLIVINIIIWIVLCFILSKDKCCQFLNNKNQNRWFKNLLWAITICLFLINILLIFLILFHFYSCIQIIHNSFCSFFKISYHTYFGEEKNYEMRPKWIGVNEIKNLLLNTKGEIENIINNNKEIYNIFNHDIKNEFYFELNNNTFVNNQIKKFCDISKFSIPNPDPFQEKPISNFYYCPNILNLIQNEYNEIFNKIIKDIDDIYEELECIDLNKNEVKFSLDNARNKIDSFVKIINDLELQYLDKVYYIYNEIINKYFIISFYIFFIFALLIDFIGLISITSFICCSNSKYCYKLHLFILNMLMLIVIIIALITIIFSSFSTLAKDISTIIKYSIYFENDNLEKNTIFSFSKFQYDIEGINICINGNGKLDNYMQLYKGSEPLVHFYSRFNLIKENLYFLLNNKFLLDKNGIKKLFEQVEKEIYLIQYQLEGDDIEENYFNNDTYLNPEFILERVLNEYTNNKDNQNIGNNSYYANYQFVHSDLFCSNDYNFISKEEVTNYYKNGKNCMKLKNFPENIHYFRGISIKNLERYNLDNLTEEFKNNYYGIDKGFESEVLKIIEKSKNYYNEIIEKKYVIIKDMTKKVLQIIDNKIDILFKLYGDVIGKNNTDLLSAFDCKFLKRDINIFLNQLENHLSRSLYILSVYTLIIAIFSLICAITSTFTLKVNKMINDYESRINIKNDIDDKDIDLSEKPKINIIGEKNIYDENLKSSFNEKIDFNKKNKIKNNNELSKENTK